MGKWAKGLFGREEIGEIGVVLAGTIRPEVEKEMLGLFDEVLSSRDAVYHGHLVRKGKKTYPVVTNVYGAPAMVDVLAEMHDGGCRTVMFIGYAYGGFKNLDVGSIMIPERSYHFDGLYHAITLDREAAFPDKDLKRKIEALFTQEQVVYVNGVNISVPAVTFQLPHHNQKYLALKPDTVEMELAACLSRAADIGVRAVGVLVISDNRSTSIHDAAKKQLRYDAKRKVAQALVRHLDDLQFPSIKMKKPFTIDEHLASIIEDPKNKINIYRNT